MLRPYSCLASDHDLGIVAFAVAICIIASLTAFTLASGARLAGTHRLRWTIILGGVTGTGIWATHFISMLAYRPSMPTVYTLDLTLLSIAIAVLMTTVGWWAALSNKRWGAWAAGISMAAGIAAMHFTGMAAFRTMGHVGFVRGMWQPAPGADISSR